MAASSIEKRMRKPKTAKFYRVSIGGFHTAPGVKIENTAALNGGRLLMPPPGRRGFPPLPESPRLLIDRSLGRAPGDWELFYGFRLASDRMKDLLESIDREGVVFLKCETRSLTGPAAPTYWLCDVIRVLDAIDEQKSQGTIVDDGTPYRRYDLMAGARLVFKQQAVGSAHIFRPRFWVGVICDQIMKDACREAGMRGISFEDVSRG
ncbi:hypothetical protein XH88_29310 [Bradyrhizobium sp. CCBAU 51627]|nr:hypothetical protein [Bradyrhizobium sp. CCBAU 51627]